MNSVNNKLNSEKYINNFYTNKKNYKFMYK